MKRSFSSIRRVPRIAATLCIVAATGAATFAASGEAHMRSARARSHALSLHEVGRLHLLSKHGFTLNESGPASGTFKGRIYVRLRIVSTSSVKAEIRMHLHSGSIISEGRAAYHRGKTEAHFAGRMSVLHGTGAYRDAAASGLAFAGTIQRSGDAIAVVVHGAVKA